MPVKVKTQRHGQTGLVRFLARTAIVTAFVDRPVSDAGDAGVVSAGFGAVVMALLILRNPGRSDARLL